MQKIDGFLCVPLEFFISLDDPTEKENLKGESKENIFFF